MGMAKRKLAGTKKSGSRGQLASVAKADEAFGFRRLPVLDLASGDSLTIPVYDFEGSDPDAPSVYLQSAMHGPEVQGSLVLALMVAHLKENPPQGRVRIVPNANPAGLNAKVGEYTNGRFDTVTGDNFNRRYFLPTTNFAWDDFLREHAASDEKAVVANFRTKMRRALESQKTKGGTIADRIAITLQLLSIDFDHCLDLHCANVSVRHLYAPEHTRADSAYLQIPHVLLIPNDSFTGAKDEVFFHPWQELARRRGNPAAIAVQSFTLELGDQETVDRRGAEKDLAGILSYLAHRGVLAGKPKKIHPVFCALENYATIHSPRGGLVEWRAVPGEKVRKGQVVATILQFHEDPIFHEVKSPCHGIVNLRHSSAIVHEGAELMKIVGTPSGA
ncbi:MAG: succinylglutamate desuccinylase [Proteobacteria bacterium]|nr:MAG: succinylglutamate desuccinylase [Pseudomonadota bacterium]